MLSARFNFRTAQNSSNKISVLSFEKKAIVPKIKNCQFVALIGFKTECPLRLVKKPAPQKSLLGRG